MTAQAARRYRPRPYGPVQAGKAAAPARDHRRQTWRWTWKGACGAPSPALPEGLNLDAAPCDARSASQATTEVAGPGPALQLHPVAPPSTPPDAVEFARQSDHRPSPRTTPPSARDSRLRRATRTGTPPRRRARSRPSRTADVCVWSTNRHMGDLFVCVWWVWVHLDPERGEADGGETGVRGGCGTCLRRPLNISGGGGPSSVPTPPGAGAAGPGYPAQHASAFFVLSSLYAPFPGLGRDTDSNVRYRSVAIRQRKSRSDFLSE